MQPETLSQLFVHNVTTFSKSNLLSYTTDEAVRVQISSDEFRNTVVKLACGLKQLGVQQQSKVIVLAENCPQWHMVDFACHLLGAIVVPIFPTLVPKQILYVLENSESEFIVVSNAAQLEKIVQIQQAAPGIKWIISMQPVQQEGAKLTTLDRVVRDGAEKLPPDFLAAAVKLAKPDDIATIIYTSGTTGVPKGVMLSHKNFIANMRASGDILPVSPADQGLSFLPLSHAFERTIDYVYFNKGVSIHYTSNIENVVNDIQSVRPTIMGSVPRFYEKIKSRILAAAEEGGAVKKMLFSWALSVGLDYRRQRLGPGKVALLTTLKHHLASKLVLTKIQAKLGGRINFFISGGAPLSAEVAQFFFAAGLPIVEGYGLTETSPILTVNPLDKPKFGTVGRPLSNVEIKIAEDGEIMAKGPNIMLGYYKMPEETREVLVDGWFYTGDIGVIDDDGYLKITDRKKELIVTSVGKKIAPAPIEKTVQNSSYIETVVLVGEKRRYITALIVPDFHNLRVFAEESHISAETTQDLIAHPKVLALIKEEVDRQQNGLAHYQQIQKFSLLEKPFSIEAGQLTPTLKVKRKVVVEEFAELVNRMYN